MAFRAVFVIDHRAVYEKSKETVIFKRVFPIVERKFNTLIGLENYKKIPLNFAELIVEELQLYRSNEFTKKFDSCSIIKTPPVYKLLDLFPVVAFEKGGLVYACVVFEEKETLKEKNEIMNSFDSSGIILGYEMLENMASCIGKYDYQTNIEAKVSLLNSYVSIGFPFGLPSELDINTCMAMLSTSEGASIPKIKAPSWRPVAYKGKQILHLEIKEKVRALQFDHLDIPDACEVYGTVVCKVDVEESPEVGFTLLAPLDSLTLTQMIYHSCVQLVDEITPVMKSGQRKNTEIDMQMGARKLKFCPPYDAFELCHYKAQLEVDDFPVRAFYQMKGDACSANVMIQLKLSKSMKNSFEHFNVHIPFFNRTAISNVRCLTSSAALTISRDKSNILWNVGSKFPGKSTDIGLEAMITFGSDSPLINRNNLYKGLNSFIELSWQSTDFTYSGLKFDPKSVELYPNSKIKVTSNSFFRTIEYKVWNSHGKVPNTTFQNAEEQQLTLSKS